MHSPTTHKGNASEVIVLSAYVQAGFVVALPFGGGAPYDLIVDTGHQLLRVQVKTGRLRKGCVLFLVRRFSGHSGKGREYKEGEIDLFTIYCPDNQQIYVVPASLFRQRHEGRLRLEQARNNQQQNIRWAGEFELERFLKNAGEKMVELRGLEPLTS